MRCRLLLRVILLAVAPAALLGSCARVPPESVQLNQAVAGQLEDLRRQHAGLARAYLDARREKFDDWFLTAYEPAFRRNYARAWSERRGAAFDPADEAAHRQYTGDVIAEYEALSSQLRSEEEQLFARLDASYADAARANAAVGALLRSAAALHESEARAWDASVGRVLPGLRAEEVDRTLEELQSAALKGIGGAPTTREAPRSAPR